MKKVQGAMNQQLCLQMEDFFHKEFMHQQITGGHALNTSVSMLKNSKAPLNLSSLNFKTVT